MMRSFGAAAVLVLALAGCAGSTSEAGTPTAPPSPSAAPPSAGDPSAAPGQTWVVGRVTAGGSGPCYRLLADDGTQYALHAADGTELVKGARMRIKTERALVRINCGPGTLVEMIAAQPLH